MTPISDELRVALESDCATGVDEILDHRRTEDVQTLRALLRPEPDDPPAFQQHAIHLLGRLGDTESAAQISALLPRLAERGRINAVDALGRIDSPTAVEGVLQAANDPSPDVRRFAAYALARQDTSHTRARLTEMAQSDDTDFVRFTAERALDPPA